jgi:hypothetical protein
VEYLIGSISRQCVTLTLKFTSVGRTIERRGIVGRMESTRREGEWCVQDIPLSSGRQGTGVELGVQRFRGTGEGLAIAEERDIRQFIAMSNDLTIDMFYTRYDN